VAKYVKRKLLLWFKWTVLTTVGMVLATLLDIILVSLLRTYFYHWYHPPGDCTYQVGIHYQYANIDHAGPEIFIYDLLIYGTMWIIIGLLQGVLMRKEYLTIRTWIRISVISMVLPRLIITAISKKISFFNEVSPTLLSTIIGISGFVFFLLGPGLIQWYKVRTLFQRAWLWFIGITTALIAAKFVSAILITSNGPAIIQWLSGSSLLHWIVNSKSFPGYLDKFIWEKMISEADDGLIIGIIFGLITGALYAFIPRKSTDQAAATTAPAETKKGSGIIHLWKKYVIHPIALSFKNHRVPRALKSTGKTIWILFMAIYIFFVFDLIIFSTIESILIERSICGGKGWNVDACVKDSYQNKNSQQVHDFILQHSQLNLDAEKSRKNPDLYSYEYYYYKRGILGRWCLLANPELIIYYDKNEKLNGVYNNGSYLVHDDILYMKALLEPLRDGRCFISHEYTRLLLASLDGDTQTIKQLINSGLDLKAHNMGAKALSYAEMNGHKEVMQLLLKAGVK